jgi:phosphoglycerol transferase MdoB-like AlkP superfamily enzyme
VTSISKWISYNCRMHPDPTSTVRSARSQQGDARWRGTLGQIQQDLLLWLLLIVIMQLQRIVLLLLFRSQWSPESGIDEYAIVAAHGLRYDVSIAAYLVLPCVAASAMCLFIRAERFARAVRFVWAPIVGLLVLLIGVVDGVFFAEFHEQFNHFAFGAMQGYLGPVIESAWAEYPLGWLAFLLVVTAVAICWAFAWLFRLNWLCREPVFRATQKPPVRIAVIAAFLICSMLMIRGGIGRRPVQFKDSSATADREINKLVPNPVSSLRFAVQTHLRLMSADGLVTFLGDESIRDAAQAMAGHSDLRTVDDSTKRTASGVFKIHPSHIFLIIMESADAWVMQPEFESLHLSESMVDLANRGISSDFFISAGNGSIESVASIVTGLPEVGVSTNFQPNSRTAYATSLAFQMKALGYTPRFFKGSYLMFQRYGEFAEQQGFEVVEGAESIRRADTETNEWGVQDDVLFSHVQTSLEQNKPTFNLIISTTYHPPYDLDVHALGYPVTTPPADLPEPCELCTQKWLETVGHAWFADRSLGEFVRAVEQEFPDALFIVTGDHWSRRYITRRPPLPLVRETPLIIYGPTVLEGVKPSHVFGSHTDIAPTLIELIAPQGHEYHSFGRDMLGNDSQYSEGSGLIIGSDFVYDINLEELVPLGGSLIADERVDAARQWSGRRSGLAWWRIMEGNEFPLKDGATHVGSKESTLP